MKYLFTSLTTFFFTLSVLAQMPQETNLIPDFNEQFKSNPNRTGFKSTVGKLQLDSITAENTVTRFHYNSVGQHLSDSIIKFDTTDNIWVNYSKNEYDYNDAGLQTIEASYNWDTAITGWTGNRKVIEKFDENGNDTLRSEHYWNTEKVDWYTNYKGVKSFDENNNLLEIVKMFHNHTHDSLINSSKSEYSYTAGNLVETFDHTWSIDTKEWLKSKKYYQTYNSENKKDSIYDFRWNTTDEVWDSTYITQYYYGTDGVLDSTVKFSYSAGNWTNSIKYDYEFHKDEVTLELFLRWNTVDNVWDSSSKTVHTYDENDNHTFWGTYKYNNEWKEFMLYYYTFDDYNNYESGIALGENYMSGVIDSLQYVTFFFDYSVNVADLVVPNNWNSNHFHMVTGLENKRYWNGEHTITINETYHYNEVKASSISENTQKPGIIYPNPANDYLILKSDANENNSRLELINLQGKVILNQEVVSNNPVDIRHLDTGIYFYRIHSDNEVQTGKLIVK